jgi:peptidoglycan hydrolase-like protein with peptidoglycan-binding domain/3D (Asp-Asp-Asp) domain-containing protein
MHISIGVIVLSLVAQALSIDASAQEPAPQQREFVVTAYYSPLPGQCCYVKGSFEADKILNGNGTHGADGTPVYPGMIAAPSSYPFGTRIKLEGIGVVTVHDRGGAIQSEETGDRLDLWFGHGEEGLARALAFGKQRVRGTVYAVGTAQPKESMNLASFTAPIESLNRYSVARSAGVVPQPQFGERGLTVAGIQEKLKQAGYFVHDVTGFYGDVTKAAIRAFYADMRLDGDGSMLTQTGSAFLAAAVSVKYHDETVPFVDAQSSEADVAEARRLLRHLGYYRGRTTGPYDARLASAVVAFQKDHGLIADDRSPGAGRIGPVTRGAIARRMRDERVRLAAKRFLLVTRIRSVLSERGLLPSGFAAHGAKGDAIASLQRTLAAAGFFDVTDVSGFFGPVTRDAVLRYQLAKKVVQSPSDPGAGTIGPSTLELLREEQVVSAYKRVRGGGWEAL